MAQVPDAFVIVQAFAVAVAFLAVSAQAGLSSMTKLKGAKHLLPDGFRQQQLLEMGGRQLLQLTDPWSSAPECPGKLVPRTTSKNQHNCNLASTLLLMLLMLLCNVLSESDPAVLQ
jgi:hypothetical protein